MAKERNSGVELFRILATLLVLVVHLNGWMVGGIADSFDESTPVCIRIGQHVIWSLSLCCVNCFLVISGWFGVKLKFTTLYRLWILIVSVYVPFYIANVIITPHDFSIWFLLQSILVFPRESYFVQNYIMLLFLSPVLNSFIDKYNGQITKWVKALFIIEFTMESVFANKCLFIEKGYSLFHFVVMYMLGRVAFINKEKLLYVHSKYFITLFFCVLYY